MWKILRSLSENSGEKREREEGDVQSTGEGFLEPWDTYHGFQCKPVMQDNVTILASVIPH